MSEYIEVFKRTEIKYLLSEEQYRELFSFLETMAEVDQYGETTINNIYFDTPDFRLVRTSLEKPIYKEKLRLRTYGSTDDDTNSFIEIKKKFDGIVYKRRVSGRYEDAYKYLVQGGKPLDDSQISREIEGFRMIYENLLPAMTIRYDRIAMAGKDDPEFRVTFDRNIRWNNRFLDLRYNIGSNGYHLKSDNKGKSGIPIIKEGQRMMEIKVANAMPLELAKKLSELEIYPVSFSKYGRGYQDMIRRQSGNYLAQSLEEIKKMEKGVISYA